MKYLILLNLTLVVLTAQHSFAQQSSLSPTYDQSNCRYRSSMDTHRFGWVYVSTPGVSPDLDREPCLNVQRSMILRAVSDKNSITHTTDIADEGSVEFRPSGEKDVVRCTYSVPKNQTLSEQLLLYVHDLLPLPTNDVEEYRKLVTPLQEEMRTIVFIECMIS